MTCCNRWHFLKAVWRLWWGPHWVRCVVTSLSALLDDMDLNESPSGCIEFVGTADAEGCWMVSVEPLTEDDEPTPEQMNTTTGGSGTTHFLVLPSKYWKN